jgi:predicted RNA-binding Zn ribbon-like protein
VTIDGKVLPAWVQTAEVKPAPMPLLLVQAFVNTWEADEESDLFLQPPTAAAWLTEAHMLAVGDALTEDELHLARAIREGIRALLVANNGGPAASSDDVEPLQELAERRGFRAAVEEDGRISFRPEPEGGLEAELARLLIVMRDAQGDGTWRRLKACFNPDCRWAFYDRSHSRRGTWCDMAVCGNRMKNRKLRERRR